MRTKHICVLSHIRIKGAASTINMFKPSSIFSDHSDASFVDYFCYLCFTFCSAVGNVSNSRYVSDCRSRGCEFNPSLVPYFRRD